VNMPEEDRYLRTKAELMDQLTVLLGGRAAEEVVFGDQTTGAAEDLKQATEIAKRMVVEYGMSEELGPLSLGKERTNIFLGEEIVKSDEHSEELTASIDREIRRFVLEAYARAKDLVSRYRTALDRLAQELLKRETLDKEDVDKILADLIPQPVG